MKALYWFRNDLRLTDNQGLAKCLDKCEEVIPIYIIDERQFQPTQTGHKRTAFFRTKFLLESLEDLKTNLRKLGSDLMIKTGIPEEELPKIALEYDLDVVYCSKEVTTEEVEMERLLEAALNKVEKHLLTTWQSTLYHEEDIPWPIHRLPEVFTHFRKEAEKESTVRPSIDAPTHLPAFSTEYGDVPAIESLGITPKPLLSKTNYPFSGGETSGMARLHYYLFESDLISTYKATRNGLIGKDYSSKFSAWLSLGCLSPRTIYEEVKKYERERKKNQSTYWLVFELIWRDYFRFVAKKHGNKLFLLKGIKNEDPQLKNDLPAFEKWCKGETGVPFIDANMAELNQTGFMSNRGRQNVASFLVNDLGVNWTWGASYFESLLVDYDPCSNWGNWAYVAGVGNDPRKDRYFNIEAQAERYDPKGAYVNSWLGVSSF
ncbi:MAG: DASH family cryptochrome [Bacteroidota bacterium]